MLSFLIACILIVLVLITTILFSIRDKLVELCNWEHAKSLRHDAERE